MKMNKLEKYLIENHNTLKACDKYITNGYILVNKEFIENKLIKSYKTQDEDLCEMIKLTYEQGELWELPEFVKLGSYGKKYFIYNENYGFDYDFIEIFYSIDKLLRIQFYIVKHYGAPTIKVFIDGGFAGLFMACKVEN